MSHAQTTIVVLSHNNLPVTKKFLDLLFSHTEKFNLIMIDNGSTDGTVNYLNETLSMFGNPNMEQEIVTLVLNQENLGVIGGRNMGYAIFQSDPTEYLCLLDNDQFVQKGWLEQYHDFMNVTNSDIIGADAWLMNKNFKPIYNCKKINDAFTYVGCGGMMIKKEVLDKIGMFDERFNPAYFEDPDFNFRARQSGYKISWNFSAKITHLPHQTLGKSKDRMKYFQNSYEKFKSKWDGIIMNPIIQSYA